MATGWAAATAAQMTRRQKKSRKSLRRFREAFGYSFLRPSWIATEARVKTKQRQQYQDEMDDKPEQPMVENDCTRNPSGTQTLTVNMITIQAAVSKMAC